MWKTEATKLEGLFCALGEGADSAGGGGGCEDAGGGENEPEFWNVPPAAGIAGSGGGEDGGGGANEDDAGTVPVFWNCVNIRCCSGVMLRGISPGLKSF